LTQPLTGFNSCGAGSSGGDTYFTIAAVGDLLLHYNIIDTANRLGYDYLFDKVRPYLQAADLTYANHEGTSNPNAPYSGDFPIFNYDPRLAKAAAKAGIDIVSTANNHAMDSGPGGVDATIQSLEAAGLAYHGTTARNAKRQPYQTFELKKNGVTVKGSFLSYTWGTNGIPDPYGQVNELWDSNGRVRQSVKDDIAQARRDTELVMVAVHWGNEYEFSPGSQQIQGAKELTAAGADIILGDHPHTLQPVDLIESGGRQAMLIYSLGNFIAAQQRYQAESYTQTSLIFYLGITRQADGKIVLNGYRYLPIYIENDTRPAPILAGAYPDAYRHILSEMRDPNGLRVVKPDEPTAEPVIPVCPQYTFAEKPGLAIPGDFAQYFATLGTGDKPYALAQSLALIGFPTSQVVDGPSGDCTTTAKILYTERARLELQPGVTWPFRVVGTQLGTLVYFKKYKPPFDSPDAIPRRQDLKGNAIANQRFKNFFNAYGGLTMFGYPISDELTETDPDTGKTKIVQYFERARFEYVRDEPENPNPLYKVQLGLLTKEYDEVKCS
jgi:poly-gamma-glutamate capsule biosynthesis protein CapA/YwtB (metallophosphatase superfamily)